MAKLLYVESSPRKQRSASIEVCRVFLDVYRKTHPLDDIETLDIWATQLPEFDGPALDAKYAGLSGTLLTPVQVAAWEGIRRLAAPFLAADKILLGVPLWNFGIPYRLKHLIDLISQKDVLFAFDETGFAGLAKAKRAAVVYARGLDYFSQDTPTPAAAFDLQRPYIQMWLRFIGVADIHEVLVEKTLLGPEVDATARATARREAEALAREF